MNDYGKGGILGATMLPATSSVGLLLLDRSNSILVSGLIAITVLGFVLQLFMVVRYFINQKNYKVNQN